MNTIAIGKEVAVKEERFTLPDIPPTSTKGEAIEKDLKLHAEIKGILPYMWEERTQDKSVICLYGVPVMAMDIEDGKIEKVYKKQEQVEKIAKEIRSGQSERRLLAGTIYGVAKDINTGEVYYFRRNVGHYDVVKNTLVGYLGLIFDENYQEVRKKVLKGEVKAYEQFVAIQDFIRNNTNKIAGELYKRLIVSDENGNEFLKNPFDIPKANKVYIFSIKTEEGQRILISNTREYRALVSAYAEKVGLEDAPKISLSQFPYIKAMMESAEFVKKLNEFFSERKGFEKEGDKTLPINPAAEEFFNLINLIRAIEDNLYTGQVQEKEEVLDEETKAEIVQGITQGLASQEQHGIAIAKEEEHDDILAELEDLIEGYLEEGRPTFFQGR